MRGIVGAAGAFEPKLDASGKKFNLHLHIVLDAQSIDEAGIAKAWAGLTRGRGIFALQKNDSEIEKQGIDSLAAYIAKADSWCPEPGIVDSEQFEALRNGSHGRQALVLWGRCALRGGRRHGNS